MLLKKYFKKIILILNLFCASIILLSYLSPYIDPISFYPVAFLGLIYPFLLFINFIFLFFWLIQKSKFFLISTISILLGWEALGNFFQFNIKHHTIEDKNSCIKVLTYNVRVFNLWSWSRDKNTAIKIYNYIKSEKANIVCLQEFYSKKTQGRNAADSLLNNSLLKNAHISYALKKNKHTNYGIATFSSFPMINKGDIKIKKEDNFCIYTDLIINNDTLRIYNIHLESIHLGEKDYQVIDKINSDDTLNVEGLRSIYWKFKKSYKKRSLQAKKIASHIEKCKYPIILCGDFNDTPVSFVYNELTGHLNDAFKLSGIGIGNTYINKYKTFRIDYILHSPQLQSFNFTSPSVKLSDHYPVYCNFEINKHK